MGSLDSAIGGWKELGRVTLGSANTNLDVTGLTSKRYLMFLVHALDNGTSCNYNQRVGNGSFDTNTNYALRRSENGAADGTLTSNSSWLAALASRQTDSFSVGYIANLSTKEKLMQIWLTEQNGTAASSVPNRYEGGGKWANTTNVIDRLQQFTTSNNYASGSELVVLGYDPADTHTDNFWQELASDTGDGVKTTLSTGTLTPKKYYWIQAFLKTSSTVNDNLLRVGNGSLDSNTNYAIRRSIDGGTDSTFTSQTHFGMNMAPLYTHVFWNVFIVNVSTRAKLAIEHAVFRNSAGAANAPSRSEQVAKWVNTTNQANIIGIVQGSSVPYQTGSILKVWGAD